MQRRPDAPALVHSLLALPGYCAIAHAVWTLLKALRYGRRVERRVRIVGYDAAGRSATVETGEAGPLVDVRWPIRTNYRPPPGSWHSVIHPPGDPGRLMPGMGWRGSLLLAAKQAVTGLALVAAAFGMMAPGLT